MKIYTKKGDGGKTSLVDGSSVAKSNPRLGSYGGLDELNSHVGVLVATLDSLDIDVQTDRLFLRGIQNQLFDLGSQLACSDADLRKKLPQVNPADVVKMESEMDRLSEELPELKNFILPGGHAAGAQAHICRSVCRRVERDCVIFFEGDSTLNPSEEITIPFLNRLSDYFFVLSRSLNLRLNCDTPLWSPQKNI